MTSTQILHASADRRPPRRAEERVRDGRRRRGAVLLESELALAALARGIDELRAGEGDRVQLIPTSRTFFGAVAVARVMRARARTSPGPRRPAL